MLRGPRKLLRLERFQKYGEALVQSLENGERRCRIGKLGVFEVRPFRFFVCPDARIVLRQRETEADVRVHMAVREVVNDLTTCPSAIAITAIEAAGRQRRERGVQLDGKRRDVRNPLLPLLGRDIRIVGELADRIPIVHGPIIRGVAGAFQPFPGRRHPTRMTRMLSVFFMLLLAPLPLFAQAEQWPVAARGDWSADTRQWWSDDGERRIQLSMRTDGDGRWGSGVRLSELDGFPPSAESGLANDVRFSWTREAGIFRFQGSFDRGRGHGTFTFAANPAYVSGMAALGHRNLTSDNLVRLALIDITQAYTRALRDVGYGSLALDDLVRMRIHRVSAEEIKELNALGYKGLDADQLVRFRIHKVTPAFIKAIHDAGYKGLSNEELVRFRIHRVTPEFIRGLTERNYRGLLAEDLVKMAIHKVSVQEIDELKALGYGGLLSDELVKLRIHKVTPQFIRSIHEVGFRSVSIDQLVRMRIHKVDAQFIKDLQADGYRNLTASDVIDLAIRGPRYSRVKRSPV